MLPLVVAATAFSFGGGDVGDLTRRLAAWSGRPTVALVQGVLARPRTFFENDGYKTPQWKDSRRVPAFKLSLEVPGDGKTLVRMLRTKAFFESSAKPGGIAIWDAAWQPSTTLVQGDGVHMPNGWREAREGSLRLDNGTVTVSLGPREAMQVGQIAEGRWSRPIKVHWLLAKMWVVPEAHGESERDVLSTLAKAVSGRLVEEKAAWRIELDPAAFRPRALATIDLIEEKGHEDVRQHLAGRPARPVDLAVPQAGATLCRAAWGEIDDASITELFAKPNVNLARPVPSGGEIHSATVQYVRVYEAWASAPPVGSEGTSKAQRSLLQRVDWERPAQIWMGQNIGVTPAFPAKGGGTVLLG